MDFIAVINKLNAECINEVLENQGLRFSYSYESGINFIEFMGVVVWDDENNSNDFETVDELVNEVRLCVESLICDCAYSFDVKID